MKPGSRREIRPKSWIVLLISDTLASCTYAARGILFAARSQRNFRLHLFAAGAVLVAGAWLHFSFLEMAVLAVTVSIVIMGELLNTGMEYLLNLLEAREHPAVRAVKDVSAGAVLMAVLGSVLVGLFLFGPRLLALLKGR